MLGDGGGDQPTPPHAWKGGLITDILQDAWPEESITEALVLSPGEAILVTPRMRGSPITGQEILSVA